ncbi:MAG: hypothetical protein WCK98_06795 [bacterium]
MAAAAVFALNSCADESSNSGSTSGSSNNATETQSNKKNKIEGENPGTLGGGGCTAEQQAEKTPDYANNNKNCR